VIKKIKVSDLIPGMYIHDLDCGWREHPFLMNRFRVNSASDIEKIAQLGIRELYIDTERGLDAPEAPTVQAVHKHLENQMRDIGKDKRDTRQEVSIFDELPRAAKVYHESRQIVQAMLLDIRLGKQVELEKMQPVVTAITDSIFRNPDAMISLLRIKQADVYTFLHSVAVSTLLIAFCRALKLERPVIELVGLGGLLHDIGKMKVPVAILNKPGKLTEQEFAIMKTHVDHSRLILENTPGVPSISIDIAAQHHERYDGSGYPQKLQASEISIYGQMASIVDVYDALTSNRIYHRGEEPTAVLHKLLEWSDHHFQPKLVQHFIRAIGIYPVGSLVRLESGRLAVVIEQHHENLLHPKVRMIFSTTANTFIFPKEVDLSQPGVTDHIVSFEKPSDWKIDPTRFLQVEA
jgi:putative nucleotidyltransferase with HDIG domain